MKVCVVCFGFSRENLRKQPWRYVRELISDSDGWLEPCVVTDCPSPGIDEIDVRSVGELYSTTGVTDTVVDVIRQEHPDAVVTLLGPTSFYRPRSLRSRVDVPVVGIFASPVYTPSEVANVGAREFYRHPSHLLPHVLGSVAPGPLKRTKLRAFDHVITASRRTKRRLDRGAGGTDVSVIQTGIDAFDLEQPDRTRVTRVRDDVSTADETIVLYFTSPLTLRGTDTLIRAFATADTGTGARLVFLSRQDDGGMDEEEAYLERTAERYGVADSFSLVPRDLPPDGVKAFLSAADIIALPYKITLSTLPISILESMAVGRPVVSTNIGGIPEVLPGDEQVVEPNDRAALAAALDRFIASENRARDVGERNRRRMETHTRWDDARHRFRDILRGLSDGT